MLPWITVLLLKFSILYSKAFNEMFNVASLQKYFRYLQLTIFSLPKNRMCGFWNKAGSLAVGHPWTHSYLRTVVPSSQSKHCQFHTVLCLATVRSLQTNFMIPWVSWYNWFISWLSKRKPMRHLAPMKYEHQHQGPENHSFCRHIQPCSWKPPLKLRSWNSPDSASRESSS